VARKAGWAGDGNHAVACLAWPGSLHILKRQKAAGGPDGSVCFAQGERRSFRNIQTKGQFLESPLMQNAKVRLNNERQAIIAKRFLEASVRQSKLDRPKPRHYPAHRYGALGCCQIDTCPQAAKHPRGACPQVHTCMRNLVNKYCSQEDEDQNHSNVDSRGDVCSSGHTSELVAPPRDHHRSNRPRPILG
jgi:hypothetical protein